MTDKNYKIINILLDNKYVIIFSFIILIIILIYLNNNNENFFLIWRCLPLQKVQYLRWMQIKQ